MKKVLIPGFAFCLVCLLGSLFPVFGQEETHTNSIGMAFVRIPAGNFIMGCDDNFENCGSDETPAHPVTLTKPFYLGKYEVTQAQWVVVMGDNNSQDKGRTQPVERVSWNEVQIFIQLLNQREGTQRYRLPTEAEWEYAARAGTTTAYSFGDDARRMGNYSWCGSGPHPVGELRPNPWGLYDMHGNVWEWVQDWYGKAYYADSPIVDPQGPEEGKKRVIRGGGWGNRPEYCRSANRTHRKPDSQDETCGFRLAFTAVP